MLVFKLLIVIMMHGKYNVTVRIYMLKVRQNVVTCTHSQQ